jgi:D-arginine dehydrogenase
LKEFDVAVVGGGMAGASAAFELASMHKVVVLERENACGYHSTGRSAASFTENYGSPVIRLLAAASRAFFETPPSDLAPSPLVAPRGMVTIARADQLDRLARELARGREIVADMHEMAPDDVLERVPILRRDYVAGAFFEPRSRDIDVHATHQVFLKGLRARGGTIVTDADVTALERREGLWRIETRAGRFAAPIIVNAAGAWAEVVASLARARPIGLVPKRRTAFNVDPPPGIGVIDWPLVNDVGEEFYFKPDAGRLLVSPADATPSPPVDAQPEEVDVAIGVARLEEVTTLKVGRVTHKWAGLRSFVADGSPVVGWDGAVDGFFWLAAQGGYGIKTAPALSRATASLIAGDGMPSDLRQLGLEEHDLAPARCRVETHAGI